ncbi:MAG: T9SS type A sorting domain-containing protein [Candidatus Latescibacteria bacterium]|nr:T9SS type A sorting domain-containing protein [Candidatus Latescibacterota bacterium]
MKLRHIPALLVALALPLAAQDEYPPGTLAPEVDLELQEVQVRIPEKYRGEVPEGLTLNLPPGFSANVFAAGAPLRKPRLMVFSPDGVLHVANMGRDQIVAYPDLDKDGVADEAIVVLDGLEEAHSLAFYKGDLYVAEEHQVIRVFDDDGDGLYERREVFIADIPWRGWHDTRTLVFDEINEKAYLSIGSPCDLCRLDVEPQTVGNSTEEVPFNIERGTVLEFNDDGTGRRIFATGVRNVIGMDFHPVTNELWGNNNGHDLEGRARPPEWIDIMRDGDFMGYPLVHSYQVWNDFGIDEYQKMLPITRQDSLLAQSQKKPVALVPAHYAPMGIHFYTQDQFPEQYKNAALVAFRAGKAKLSTHQGYQVMALFSDPDGSNARMGSFITGFQTGLTQDSVWGFPVGLMTDNEGSLYVTSDNRNHLILKITHSQISGSWEHNLPDAITIGTAIDIDLRVQIDRLAESGEAPRLQADLSALGGAAASTLEETDTGAYMLRTQLDLTDVEVGSHTVRVSVIQQVGERQESLDFFKDIVVLPLDLQVFDDQIANGWTMVGTEGAQVLEPTGAGEVFSGESASLIEAEPASLFANWAVDITPPNPIDRLGFVGLRFAFHPGEIEASRISILNVVIGGLAVDLVRVPVHASVDLENKEWQTVDIPFSAFDTRREALETIDSIRLEGNMKGLFYLDNIRVLTSFADPPPSTAVVEVRDEGQPQGFALEQNYPNPFNSATTIRYAMPTAGPVELAVFNMDGQHVATLIKGMRQAGAYTLRWDGRDNRGRAVASGIYLYRLRAGDWTQTQKLTLLR